MAYRGIDSVWVGNYGHYNEGRLVGSWLELPFDEAGLDRWLREKAGVDDMHEEVGVFDTDLCGPIGRLGVKVDECAHLDELNALSRIAATVPDGDIERAAAYLEGNEGSSISEAANLLMQIGELDVYRLESPGWYGASDAWRMGWTVAHEMGGVEELSPSTKSMHFDYAGYAEELVDDGVLLGREGYIGSPEDLDDELYEPAELTGMVIHDASYAMEEAVADLKAAGVEEPAIARAVEDEGAGAVIAAAEAISRLSGRDLRAFEMYTDNMMPPGVGPFELANIALQVEEIDYADLPSGPGNAMERLGMELADRWGLDADRLDAHFDYEDFGRTLLHEGLKVVGDFYIDTECHIDLERYDASEIQEAAKPAAKAPREKAPVADIVRDGGNRVRI